MDSSFPKITRRQVVKALLGAAFLPSSPSHGSASAAPTGPSLNVFPDYGWLRGFSMVPSWGARIEDAWWLYDSARMREEVALAKQVHANCIRLWIEFSAWMRDPEKMTANFLDAVAAIDEAGMKVMPCLFNRWHDRQYDYGGTYLENMDGEWKPQSDYIRALVTPLAADERILIWDLCNEPGGVSLDDPATRKQYDWLEKIGGAVRSCGVRQPITIGAMSAANVDLHAPLVDVLCGHPYPHDRAGLREAIEGYAALRKKHAKPLLVNETIPGCLDDRKRAETARFFTEMLADAGMGWMGWALREGLAISTRRDRYDNNGINGEGFHPFFTKAGHLREGLEFLTEKPKLLPPWQS